MHKSLILGIPIQFAAPKKILFALKFYPNSKILDNSLATLFILVQSLNSEFLSLCLCYASLLLPEMALDWMYTYIGAGY